MSPIPDAPPQLVVHTDAAAVRTRFRTLLVANALLAVVALAMIGFLAMLDLESIRYFVWVFIVLMISPVYQIGFVCYQWGARQAISEPLTLDAWGVEIRQPEGTLRVPWEAVPEVRQKSWFGKQMLSFQLHPQAVPGQNGVETNPARWSRYLKKGVNFMSFGIAPGFETILPAIAHYSQGRTRIV